MSTFGFADEQRECIKMKGEERASFDAKRGLIPLAYFTKSENALPKRLHIIM